MFSCGEVAEINAIISCQDHFILSKTQKMPATDLRGERVKFREVILKLVYVRSSFIPRLCYGMKYLTWGYTSRYYCEEIDYCCYCYCYCRPTVQITYLTLILYGQSKPLDDGTVSGEYDVLLSQTRFS